jgi:hypothetical protein
LKHNTRFNREVLYHVVCMSIVLILTVVDYSLLYANWQAFVDGHSFVCWFVFEPLLLPPLFCSPSDILWNYIKVILNSGVCRWPAPHIGGYQ